MLSVDASLSPFLTLSLTFFILIKPLTHASITIPITIQIKAAMYCLQIKVVKCKTTYHNEDKRQQCWSNDKLIYVSRFFYIFLFFFYLGFLSQPFPNYRTAGEGGRHFFNSSLPLLPALQTLSRELDGRLLQRVHLYT